MKIFKEIPALLKRKKNRVRYYYLRMLAGIYTPYEFFLVLIVQFIRLVGLNPHLLDSARIKRKKKTYLTNDCYVFKDAKIPLLNRYDEVTFLCYVMDDVFYSYLNLDDNYDVNDVGFIDDLMDEGFYIYSDRARGIDLKLRPGDAVIDAGAWIGDFSAYASVCGANVYAFEPMPDTFEILQKTALLNKNITPVNMGLGAQKDELFMSVNKLNTGSSAIRREGDPNASMKVHVTTLDDFVEENKLERVDFIKADIEGHERFMLQGAKNVLKKFGPRLAVCTYHLPDDPQVLENIIKEINPAYEVIQRRKKLFAYIP